MSVSNLVAALDCVSNFYTKKGFKITHSLMDMKFGFLEDDLHSCCITLNLASAKKHVGEIEQFIRTLEECVFTEKCVTFQEVTLKIGSSCLVACESLSYFFVLRIVLVM